MSEHSNYFFDSVIRLREYLERQRRREAKHQEYLERQRQHEQRRKQQHQEYLERQARREANKKAYFDRLTDNVLRFRTQYENTLNDIKRQGLDVYIRHEFDTISQQIQQLDLLLSRDEAEDARDLSLQIGQSIHGLIRLAREEKRRIERKEEQLSLERKRKQEAEIQRQARQEFIEQMKRNLEADSQSNPEAVQEAVQKLDSLKEEVESMSNSDLQEQLVAQSDKVDGEIADETVRREVIKAIYQSLKKTGFIVSTPQLTGDVVLLRAQKPAGQQAEFTVKLDGGLTFKFDNYEGSKCRKDIDEITALLDQCYGIKLSNRKVSWTNPDRIQKGSKSDPAGDELQAKDH